MPRYNLPATDTSRHISNFSFIGSGDSNMISAPTALADHGVIAGGVNNNIIDAACAVISGGSNNIVTGNGSAILGGVGNSDGGQPNMGIYGTGILATTIPSPLGAFWANELIIPNIPPSPLPGSCTPPPGYPIGSLYWDLNAGGHKIVLVV